MPTDLDGLFHMNNGKYLSLMDVARFEFMQRTRLFRKMRARGWYPVVANQTISYRKSLNPFQKFAIETKLIGADERAAYMEQRFVRRHNGTYEIYARAYVQARFLSKAGGTVPVDELIAEFGIDPEQLALPQFIADWAAGVRLPSPRSEAPSVWE